MFSYIIHIIWTVLIHDGIKYNKNNKNNILMDSEKHGMHHKYPLKNFAFIIYYWDIVFNTNH
jgi:sterol desaturase/sphingolipid hydroxylase (fatty acid hydroxylase superfamily)